MAKPEDHVIETSKVIVGDIATPDKDTLGCVPVEYVAVVLDTHDSVVPFHPLDPGYSAAADIQFAIGDLPVGSLLADVDTVDTVDFDLNELLGGSGTDQMSVATPDGSPAAGISGSVEPSVLDALHDAGIPDPSQLSLHLVFPQLTFVIDDEPGQATVAL